MAACIGIVDGDGDVYIDPAKRIDHRFEAIEVDFGIMGNRHTGKLRDGFHHKSRTAIGIGRIDFSNAIPFNIHKRVALNRNKRHFLLNRINARQHRRVASIAVSIFATCIAFLGFIGAHKEHIEWLSERFIGQSKLRIFVDALRQLAIQNAHIRESRANANDSKSHHCGNNPDNDLLPLFARTHSGVFRTCALSRIGNRSARGVARPVCPSGIRTNRRSAILLARPLNTRSA